MLVKKLKTRNEQVGVVLMTYGSPKTLDDIPTYLKNVYGGREASREIIAEFRRRYSLIELSPLVKITQAQAAALEKELNKNSDYIYRVVAGMRFAPPFIHDVVAGIAKSSQKLVGIIMSPQYSPIIMSGYVRDLKQAVSKSGNKNLKLSVAKDWYLQPFFLKAIAQRVNQALTKFPEKVKETIPVLFSAHSMPKRVVEGEKDYINALKETASQVAKLVNLSKKRWMFCYQSAGHTPEKWLKPDFADIMPKLKKGKQTHVLIAPIQFLADHLEILYDIEIGARDQAEKYNIQFARTKSLNTSPLFIKALASVVRETAFLQK